jgi:hypothetical protein
VLQFPTPVNMSDPRGGPAEPPACVSILLTVKAQPAVVELLQVPETFATFQVGKQALPARVA